MLTPKHVPQQKLKVLRKFEGVFSNISDVQSLPSFRLVSSF